MGTTETEKQAYGGGDRFLLSVDDGTRHRLQDGVELVVGRGEDCAIRIARPWISRRHVIARVSADVTVEDLGSANGTRIGGRRLAPGEVAILRSGEILELGSSVLVLHEPQTAVAGAAADDLLQRLGLECERATRGTRWLSLLYVQIGADASPEIAEPVLGAALRPGDVVLREGRIFHVILLGASADRAVRVVRHLLGDLTARAIEARVGAATFPRDGRSPGALLERAAARAAARPPPDGRLTGATSSKMAEIVRLVERFAPGRINILLEGETGVGKEVIAELIHRTSTRAAGPFLRLNCAAFSEQLLESELFGHERGAFTGAGQTKLGLLETASGGTVFLDEVGELPLGLQAKLLRVLEDREVRRVGALKPLSVDVRFVAATNRHLREEVAAKRFRQDLFFRLDGATIKIPPLRERLEELEAIAQELLADACAHEGAPPAVLAPETLAVLLRHSWPGNVRELRNVLERAILLAGEAIIRPEHLQLYVEAAGTIQPPPAERPSLHLKGQLAEVERATIVAALAECRGNQTLAAKQLGISRKVLIARMEAHAIERPRKGN